MRLGSFLGSTWASKCSGLLSANMNSASRGTTNIGFGKAASGKDAWRWYLEAKLSSTFCTFSNPVLPCGCCVSKWMPWRP